MSERRSADTLEKILEVAETAFAREGYEGAHLQHIAGLVGVQKTALYYYFPSKAALYEAVLRRILQAFDETIGSALDREETPAKRLYRLHDSINDLLAERRNYARILIRIFVDRPDVNLDETGPLVESVVGRLLVFFKEGMEAGVFRRGSPRHMFQSAMGTLVFHYATGEIGGAILGVEDIFSSQAVQWRRREVRRTALLGILIEPEDSEST